MDSGVLTHLFKKPKKKHHMQQQQQQQQQHKTLPQRKVIDCRDHFDIILLCSDILGEHCVPVVAT